MKRKFRRNFQAYPYMKLEMTTHALWGVEKVYDILNQGATNVKAISTGY